MQALRPFISSLFSAPPAVVFSIYTLVSSWEEYYWPTHVIMTLIYIGISIALGWLIPITMQNSQLNYPWLWLLLTGILAWMATLIGFSLLNLTPLCVGQDNGDGLNDYTLCSLYSIVIILVYSPVMLVLITLNAVVAGKIIDRLAMDPNK